MQYNVFLQQLSICYLQRLFIKPRRIEPRASLLMKNKIPYISTNAYCNNCSTTEGNTAAAAGAGNNLPVRMSMSDGIRHKTQGRRSMQEIGSCSHELARHGIEERQWCSK